MNGIPKIILGPGKDQSLKRFHPWVFSGAIKKMETGIAEGDTVEVFSNRDEYLGTGHYQKGSIAVRIFSFKPVAPDENFWAEKIENAYRYRKQLGLTDNKNTNAYRLIHAEADGLSGLIIDYYNGTAVLQAHSAGMHKARPQIAQALKKVYQQALTAVYDKSRESLTGVGAENQYLFGTGTEKEIMENGHRFKVDWEEGQKTGFFIDQRENRKLLAYYAPQQKMLDCFCYAGGFSVYALKAGAQQVTSVDASQNAIAQTRHNVALNFGTTSNHAAQVADAFDFLKDNADMFNLMVIDPPAFAKHREARHSAVMGYKRLNALAIKGIKPGGIIFTFSCSQVVDKYLFYGAITAAAIEAGRTLRIMHYLSQPPDHPISIYHPEGEYLKGMVLQVE